LGDSTAQNSVDGLVHLVTSTLFRDTLLLTALRYEMFAMDTVQDLSIVCSSRLTINMWMISTTQSKYFNPSTQKYNTIVCGFTCEEAHYQNVGPLPQHPADTLHFALQEIINQPKKG